MIGNSKNISRDSPFQIYIVKSVLREIEQHAGGDARLECSGVLIGDSFRTPSERVTFVVVAGAVPHQTNRRGIGHVTIGPDEIAETRAVIERDHPNLIPVGWYHSHPGHGIFLSSQDMVIVRSIYNLSWHIALVVDPIRKKLGFFYGAEGKSLDGWLELSDAEFLNKPDKPQPARQNQKTDSSLRISHDIQQELLITKQDNSITENPNHLAEDQSHLDDTAARKLYEFAITKIKNQDQEQALRDLKRLEKKHPYFNTAQRLCEFAKDSINNGNRENALMTREILVAMIQEVPENKERNLAYLNDLKAILERLPKEHIEQVVRQPMPPSPVREPQSLYGRQSKQSDGESNKGKIINTSG